MKRILVTGAAGFIGTNFVRLLLAERADSCQLIAYDALTYAGNLANLADCEGHERFEFIRGDICDEKQVVRMEELLLKQMYDLIFCRWAGCPAHSATLPNLSSTAKALISKSRMSRMSDAWISS